MRFTCLLVRVLFPCRFHATPCCTGNQARLLPNYIHHMWWGTADGGLAATMYGPSMVRTRVGSSTWQQIEVVASTQYPFEDHIIMKISKLDRSVLFPLLLRIPAWCTSPELSINGQMQNPNTVDKNGFARITRMWRQGDVVNLTLPAELRATKRVTFANGHENKKWNGKFPWTGQNVTSGLPFCVVERGSLTFAFPVERNPRGPFGYAIDCNASKMQFIANSLPSMTAWDWPVAAPVKVVAKACPFNWSDVWRLPSAAIGSMEVTGPEQEIELIPYGNTKVLRISMFPYVDGSL